MAGCYMRLQVSKNLLPLCDALYDPQRPSALHSPNSIVRLHFHVLNKVRLITACYLIYLISVTLLLDL